MSEWEEIGRLIEDFQTMWGRMLRNVAWDASYRAARNALFEKIRSIIAERDALKAAMKSHRGE